ALAGTLGYIDDLISTLDTYHQGGLWHKDVKPDNIIVDGTHAQLVDFGLLTSLRSSLTLTTHGTEYFRDPEMVRMALRGVKVHQINGAKFDIYGAGAVLYSAIENSFPAHGGLSHITKRCPEALRWIIRRAMTDYDKRYESAAAMLADLRVVAGAAEPFAVKPVDLPSMKGHVGAENAERAASMSFSEEPGRLIDEVWPRMQQVAGETFRTIRGESFTYAMDHNTVTVSRTDFLLHRWNFEKALEIGTVSGPGEYNKRGVRGPSYVWAILHDPRIGAFAPAENRADWSRFAAAPSPPPPPFPEPAPAPRLRPKLRVANWWTGRYQVDSEEPIAVARRGSPRAHAQTAAASVAASLGTVADGFSGAAARREARRRPSRQ
ncbi:MAG: hypothetical protein IID31_11760, partial [Planctomycetes bacterium]|nr:hypothetical protein [Planctomycetota bacterium]